MSEPAFTEPAGVAEPAFIDRAVGESAVAEPSVADPAAPAGSPPPAEPAASATEATTPENSATDDAEANVAASAAARSAERGSVEGRLAAAMSGAAAAHRGIVRSTSPATYAVGRGVTGRGVVALIAGATFVGGLADLAVSGHRAYFFGILFAIASGVAAFVVRRRDLRAAMIAPPLVYCLLILIMSLIDRNGLTGSFSTRETYYVGNAFVTGAPAIWIGTALAAGIGWLRGGVSGRRGRR
ncbi:MAG: DUF6542 domain-containing protein [Acidothermaceae bacterium]